MNRRAQPVGHAAVLVLAGLALCVFFPPSTYGLLPERLPDTVAFSVKNAAGKWRRQSFSQLTDIHHQQQFPRVSFNGSWLRTAHMRSFNESYELTFGYRFDRSGKRSARQGSVRKYGSWSAEADLFPSIKGAPPASNTKYTKGAGLDIAEPEDGPEYARNFNNVENFRIIGDLPCAASLKAMEKN